MLLYLLLTFFTEAFSQVFFTETFSESLPQLLEYSHYIVVWDIETHQASPTISSAQLWAAPVNWNTGAAEEFGSPLDPQLSLGAFAEHGTLPGQDFGKPSTSQPSLAASVERGTRPGQDFEGPPDSQLSLGEFAEHDTY